MQTHEYRVFQRAMERENERRVDNATKKKGKKAATAASVTCAGCTLHVIPFTEAV